MNAFAHCEKKLTLTVRFHWLCGIAYFFEIDQGQKLIDLDRRFF